jgi:hypothetical protein
MPSVPCPNCGATGRTKKNAAPAVPALAVLNRVRQYPEAAEELFAAGERRASVGGQRAITEPISFLYYHTME